MSEEEERERLAKEKARLIFLSELNSKYKMGLSVEELEKNAVMTNLINRDKYLCLGHFMILNRGDWSSGSDYANEGLKNFNISSDEDSEIYDEISGLANNWEGDGRVFRDCKYNYDYILSLCDEDIYSDYQKLKGFI